MLRLGLVGHPIAGSLSPLLHEAALAARGLSGSYQRFDVVEPAALEAVFARLRRGELSGLNVTVPHKLAALATCHRLAPLAARLHAVNTLTRDAAGALIGWNTDLPGLVAALAEGPALPPSPRVLVLGAGGAAPAALLAAEALGASEIRIWNRTFERARALVSRLGLGVAQVDRAEAARDVDLLIQASSHGMDLTGADRDLAAREASSFITLSAPSAHVVDLVYRPRPTVWVEAALAHHRSARDGLSMLVHQAALSFELWTGARTAITHASRAAPELIAAMRSALSAPADLSGRG